MKRTLLIVALACFAFAITATAQTPVQGQTYKGQTWATGHLGYAIGMGSAFDSYTEPVTNTKFSSDAGFGFGGQLYFGVNEKWLIGGELMIQRYSFEASTPANLALSLPASSVSDSKTEVNVLANSMVALNQSKKSSLFFMGGTGLYDFDGMQLGLNTGLFWRKQVSPTVWLFGMPRFHVVFTDNTPTMVQLTMGAQFSLGS